MPHRLRWGSLLAQCSDFRELTGSVGDVALIHPFLLHSFSQNHLGKPRFISNIKLREPMNFDREDAADFAPVENAILQSLVL
jgi:hypothetical protein